MYFQAQEVSDWLKAAGTSADDLQAAWKEMAASARCGEFAHTLNLALKEGPIHGWGTAKRSKFRKRST